jgi:hypothetical protein
LAIILNAIAIAQNVLKQRSEMIQLLSISIADGLMGIKLCSLLTVNEIYKGTFMEIIINWRYHWLCLTIGCLHFTSSEASLLLLTCMMLNRVYVLHQGIVQPSAKKRWTVYTPLLIILICLGTSILVCFLTLISPYIDMGSN